MGYKREKHLLEIEAGYNLIYERLLKEARIWNNSGQYWLANESMRKRKRRRKDEIVNKYIC